MSHKRVSLPVVTLVLAGALLPNPDAHALSRRCRSLLAAPTPEWDFLNDEAVMCPFRETAASLSCPGWLKVAPPIEPTAFQESPRLGDVASVILDEELSAACTAILADPSLAKLLAEVEPMTQDTFKAQHGAKVEATEARRRLATLFASVRQWSYCHRYRQVSDSGDDFTKISTTHAIFDPIEQKITLYATGCRADSIYRQSLRELDLSFRLELISAHELGHALDLLLGRSLARAEAEAFATYFGTYLAECWSRSWESLLLRPGILDGDYREKYGPTLDKDINERFACLDEAIVEIRGEAFRQFTRLAKKGGPVRPSAPAFACSTVTYRKTRRIH
jgi:hypothetical protein